MNVNRVGARAGEREARAGWGERHGGGGVANKKYAAFTAHLASGARAGKKLATI